jgi:uncharacterized protein (TIGR03083 family)
MTPEENIQAVRRESAMLAEAARKNLAPTVPSCPDWSVSDLVWHVGGIHRHRIWLITEHPEGPSGFEIDRPKDDEIVDWFEKGAENLAHVLESHEPSEHVWTWFPSDQTVGFWQRRMAQETAVHRWDAEHAAAETHPIEAALAADGIAEFFDTLMVVQEEPTARRSTCTRPTSRRNGSSRWHRRARARSRSTRRATRGSAELHPTCSSPYGAGYHWITWKCWATRNSPSASSTRWTSISRS